MRPTTKPKPHTLPRPGENSKTDGAILAQLTALRRMPMTELKAKWEDLFAAPAPNNSRAFLELRLADRIQQLTYGGLSRETRRTLDLLADEAEGKTARKGMAGDGRNPRNGTKLVRAWNGTEHTVTVLQDGYEMGGRKFKSLSAVAKTITGTNWNGFRFFGLHDKQRGGA